MRHKNIINYIVAILIMTGMVAVSELIGDKEVIFPEVAALCVGAIVLPGLPWKVDGKRMIFYICLAAILGVLIVLFIPGPLYIQMIIAFIVSQIIYILSRTTMAPMISAIVLPVMLQTKSPVYLVSAFLLTTLIVLIRWIFVKIGHKLSVVYKAEDSINMANVGLALIRIITVSLVMLIAIPIGNKLVVAPPMLVAFTEFTRKGNKAVKRPIIAVLLITACAFVGAASRAAISGALGLPLFLAAAVTATIILFIMRTIKMFIPPAAAMGILAMLIKEDALAWYPVQVLLGISIFMFVAKGMELYRNSKKL